MKIISAELVAVLVAGGLGVDAASAQAAGAAGDGGGMLVSLLPFLILSAALAWGNYLLAEKSGRSGILFAVLTFIPVIGFMATLYLFYTSLYRALDRGPA
jgi:hypothetical protein